MASGPHEERQVPAVHCVVSAGGQGIENDQAVGGVAEEQEQLKKVKPEIELGPAKN